MINWKKITMITGSILGVVGVLAVFGVTAPQFATKAAIAEAMNEARAEAAAHARADLKAWNQLAGEVKTVKQLGLEQALESATVRSIQLSQGIADAEAEEREAEEFSVVQRIRERRIELEAAQRIQERRIERYEDELDSMLED